MAVPIKPNIGTKTDFAARPSVPSGQKESATEFNLLVAALRANYERLILDWGTDIVVNTTLEVGQYVRFTDNFIYRIITSYNVGNPLTWVGGNAVAVNSDASKFKGVYVDDTALTTVNPTGEPGDYAYVDAGVGNPVELWMWDDDDNEWVQSGSGGVGTVTSVGGTADRITSTGGATPVIDIAAAYDAAVQAYADAKVANSITNGVTTSAPNQDQVFDALALKLDSLVTLLTFTASHTLDATDLASINAGDQLVIRQNVASANNLEIPLNATQAFPVGTVIGVRNMNTGIVTITAVGGVTLTASLSAFNLANQWDMCYIEKTATNTWVANGQLSL